MNYQLVCSALIVCLFVCLAACSLVWPEHAAIRPTTAQTTAQTAGCQPECHSILKTQGGGRGVFKFKVGSELASVVGLLFRIKLCVGCSAVVCAVSSKTWRSLSTRPEAFTEKCWCELST